MRGILIFFITLYKWTLSPLLGPCCRFHPSCSEYAREAIEEYGAARGLRLAVRRLLHCHPFHPGGYDPVPLDREEMRETGCGIRDEACPASRVSHLSSQ